MSLKVSNVFQRIGSSLWRRGMVQALAINCMINSRQSSTSLWQFSFCIWHSVRCVSVSISGSSSLLSQQSSKTFLPKSGNINLILLIFILVIIFILLTGPRRLHRILRQDRQPIFRTTRGPIMIPCHTLGTYYSNKMNRGDFYYWYICRGDSCL